MTEQTPPAPAPEEAAPVFEQETREDIPVEATMESEAGAEPRPGVTTEVEEPTESEQPVMLEQVGAGLKEAKEPEKALFGKPKLAGIPEMTPEESEEFGAGGGTGIYAQDTTKPSGLAMTAAGIYTGLYNGAHRNGLLDSSRPFTFVRGNEIVNANSRSTSPMYHNPNYRENGLTYEDTVAIGRVIDQMPGFDQANMMYDVGLGVAGGLLAELFTSAHNTAVDLAETQRPGFAADFLGEVGQALAGVGIVDQEDADFFQELVDIPEDDPVTQMFESFKIDKSVWGQPANMAQSGGYVIGTLASFLAPMFGGMKALGIANKGWRGFVGASGFGAATDAMIYEPGESYAYPMLQSGLENWFGVAIPELGFMDEEAYLGGTWTDTLKAKSVAAIEGLALGTIAEAGLRFLGVVGRQVGPVGRAAVEQASKVVNRKAMAEATTAIIERNAKIVGWQKEGLTIAEIESRLLDENLTLDHIQDKHFIPVLSQMLSDMTKGTDRQMSNREARVIINTALNSNVDPRYLAFDQELIDANFNRVSPQMSVDDELVLLQEGKKKTLPTVTRSYNSVYERFDQEDLGKKYRPHDDYREPGTPRVRPDGSRYIDMDLDAVDSPEIEFKQEDIDRIVEEAYERHGEKSHILANLQKEAEKGNIVSRKEGRGDVYGFAMPTADDLTRWFSTSKNRYRFWYPLWADAAADRILPGLASYRGGLDAGIELALRWTAQDSARTGILPNIERMMARMSDHLGSRRSLVGSTARPSALFDTARGTPMWEQSNLKTPSFVKSARFYLGRSDERPMPVIDAIMAQGFGMPAAAPSNSIVFEFLADIVNGMTKHANGQIPQGRELYMPDQSQATFWSGYRLDNPSTASLDLLSTGEPATGFAEILEDIVENRIPAAGIVLPVGKNGKKYLPADLWSDPRVTDELAPNLKYQTDAPKMVYESQTKLAPEVEGAVDINSRMAAMISDFPEIQKRMDLPDSVKLTADDLKSVQAQAQEFHDIGYELLKVTQRRAHTGSNKDLNWASELMQAVRGRGTVGMTVPTAETSRALGIETGQFKGGQWVGPMGTFLGADGKKDVGTNITFRLPRMSREEQLEFTAIMAAELRQEVQYSALMKNMDGKENSIAEAIKKGDWDKGYVVPEFTLRTQLTSEDLIKVDNLFPEGTNVEYAAGPNLNTLRVYPADLSEKYLSPGQFADQMEELGIEVDSWTIVMADKDHTVNVGYKKNELGNDWLEADAEEVIEQMESRMLSTETQAGWLKGIREENAKARPIVKKLETLTLKPKDGPKSEFLDNKDRLVNSTQLLDADEIEFMLQKDPRLREMVAEAQKADPQHKGLDGIQFEAARGSISDLKSAVPKDAEFVWESVLKTDKQRRALLLSDNPETIIRSAVRAQAKRLGKKIADLPGAESDVIDWTEQFRRVVPKRQQAKFTTDSKRSIEAFERTFSAAERGLLDKLGYKRSAFLSGKSQQQRGVLSRALGDGGSPLPKLEQQGRKIRGASDYHRQKHFRDEFAKVREEKYKSIAQRRDKQLSRIEEVNAELDKIQGAEGFGDAKRYQQGPEGELPRGLVQFNEKGKLAIVRLGKAANIDTVFHEMGHVVRHHTMSSNRRGTTSLSVDMIKQVEKEYGIVDGNWWQHVDADEKFADDFTAFIASGGENAPKGLKRHFKTMTAELRDILADQGKAGIDLGEGAKELFRNLRKMNDIPIRWAPGKYLPPVSWDNLIERMRQMEDSDTEWMDLIRPEDLLGTARMNDGRTLGMVYRFDLDTPEDLVKMGALYNDLARAGIESGVLKRPKGDWSLMMGAGRKMNELLARGNDQLDQTIEEFLRQAWYDEPDEAVVAMTMMLMHQLELSHKTAKAYLADPNNPVKQAQMLRQNMNYQITQVHVADLRTKSGRALRAWSKQVKVPTMRELTNEKKAKAFLKAVGREEKIGTDLARAIIKMDPHTNTRQLADVVTTDAVYPWGSKAKQVYHEAYVNSLLWGLTTWFPLTGITSAASIFQMSLDGLGRMAGKAMTKGQSALDPLRNLKRHIRNSKISLRYAAQTLLDEQPVLMGYRAMLDDGAQDARAIHYGGDNWVAKAMINGIGRVVRVPSNAIATQDEFFRQINARTAIEERFFNRIMDDEVKQWRKGLDEAPTPKAEEAFKRKIFAYVNEEAQAQVETVIRNGKMRNNGVLWEEAMATEEVFTESDPLARVRKAYDYVQGEKRKNPHMMEDVVHAEDAAVRPVFQDALEEGSLGRVGQQLVDKLPLGRVIIPFYKTPLNILKRFGSYIPTNVAVEIAERSRSKTFGGEGYVPFRGKWQIDPDSPIAKLHHKHMEDLASGNPERVADARGRQAMGVALFTSAAYMAMSGRTTGGDPRDPDLRRARQDAKIQPYSFVVGDTDNPEELTYISYAKFEPAATVFALVNDFVQMAESLDGSGNDLGLAELAWAGVYLFAEQLKSKSMLAGVGQMIRLMESDPTNPAAVRGAMRTATRMAGTALAPVPAAQLQSQARSASDEAVRQYRGLLDYMRTRLFGLGGVENVPKQYTYFGEDRRKYAENAPANEPWINLVSSMKIMSASDDAADQAIAQLNYPFKLPPSKIEGIDLNDFEMESDEFVGFVGTAWDYWCKAHNDVRLKAFDFGEYQIENVTFKDIVREYVTEGTRANKIWKEMATQPVRDPDRPERTRQVEQILQIERKIRRQARRLMLEKFPEVEAEMTRQQAAMRRQAAKLAEQRGDINLSQEYNERAKELDNSALDLVNQLEGDQ